MAKEGIERKEFTTPFDDDDGLIGSSTPEPVNKDDGSEKGDPGQQEKPLEDNKPKNTGNSNEGPDGEGDEGIVSKEFKSKEIGDRNDQDGDQDGDQDDQGGSDEDLSENDVYNLARHWQKEGYLPEDVDIDKDISDADLSELYRKSKEQSIAQEIEQKKVEELKQKGYTDEDLRTARLVKQGIDPRSIIEADNFEALSKVNIPEEGEERERMQRQLLAIDYKNQGITDEKKIERLIDISVQEGEIDDEVEAARSRFAQLSEKKRKEQEDSIKKREEKRARDQKKNIERVKSYIKSRKVGEEEFPEKVMDKVNDAFFKKNEVFEVDGKKVKGTLWQKIRHLKKTDPDFAMKMMIRQIAADELVPDPEEVERKHSDKLIRGLSGSSSSQEYKPRRSNNGRASNRNDKAAIERRPLI